MRFKVGDTVRIVNGRGNIGSHPKGTSWMSKLVGNVMTILSADAVDRIYLVGNSSAPYCWVREEWLAPVELDDVERSPSVYPKRIYKGDGKTVVMWEDGTKTIVKRAEGEPDNDYAAFTAALAIKVFGTNSEVNRIVRMTETVEKRKKKKKPKEAERNK